MAFIKNFGLQGLNANVQLGKLGPFIKSSAGQFGLYDSTETALTNLSIANATIATHAITLAQLQNTVNDTVQHVTLDFSFNTGTTNIVTVPAGSRVITVTVDIETPWTGADAATGVQVGDGTDPDRLFRAGDVDVTTAGQYYSEYTYKYDTPSTITLSVSPGSATAGSGTVSVVLAAEGPDYGIV